ncbi:hypothetical protein SAMN05444007_103197 [Cribrihabitans marinus]|uniref:Uncharacterized protein n=1 Tax=Cribrihabitans marinus TaxID=1227549 RepID=A0A1H6VI52_9RHOB|nr:hypothetical protein [Cribrihabitans marinus]GGH25686.1 hypothetical protein GCM10010973_13000 [Cribrihabitans marinus]SEJ04349.1 hypothetical protein SAMN05444007_103197 [Cribrihabitans marinus]
MEATTLAVLILLPAVGVFAYAGWFEYRRWKQEGPKSYGLTYDPETNTTHVGALAEGEDGFDPEEFEPVNEQQDDTDAVAEQCAADTEDHAEQGRNADDRRKDPDRRNRQGT